MKILPSGRGFYIWVLARCEGGDVAAIINRCKRCGISWVAIKGGNTGSSWIPRFRNKVQLTKDIVERFHAAGIKVYAWSYDIPRSYRTKDGGARFDPDVLARQAEAFSKAMDIGCDGVVSDSETEWDRGINADYDAEVFGVEIRERCPDAAVGDAPWAYTGYHKPFPFTKFGGFVDFRCPQVYWMEISGGVERVCETYARYWDKYESRPNHPKLPHLPSGSIYDKQATRGIDQPFQTNGIPKQFPETGLRALLKSIRAISKAVHLVDVDDIAFFEKFMRDRGCPGVLHWEYSQVPDRVWQAFESGEIPRW